MPDVLDRVVANLRSRHAANPDLRLRAEQVLAIIANEQADAPVRGSWRPPAPVTPHPDDVSWLRWHIAEARRRIEATSGCGGAQPAVTNTTVRTLIGLAESALADVDA